MTEEQATKLVELMEKYNESFNTAYVLVSVIMICFILFFGWELYRLIQIKKMHQEWKSQLTQEEVEKLNKSKEYFK